MAVPGFEDRFLHLPTGIRMHYISDGEGIPVVLLHGWPDCWWGWRHQILPLKYAGFRVIVPDMRGFGQTSTPTDVAGYSTKSIANDLVALLDGLKIERAIFIGHDHGGSVAWRLCLHHSTRVIAVGSVCTPYTPPNKDYVPVETIAKLWPSFQYQVYFNDGDNPVNEFESNVRRTLSYFLRGSKDYRDPAFKLSVSKGPLLPDKDIQASTMMTKEEFEYYVQQFKTSGFAGNLNFYRNHKINYEDEVGLDPIIHHPALMITCGQDYVLLPKLSKKMERFVPNLSRGHIEQGNHWVLQEFPELINPMLVDWLRRTTSSKTAKL